MTEDKVIQHLNNLGYSFVKMDDRFSRYDAFDEERGIAVEIKCRHKHYPDTMIEKIKYQWNKSFSEDNGLEFLYVVSMPTPKKKDCCSIYVFEPVAMEDEEDYDFKWHTKKLPENTEFASKPKWIDKEVGYLKIEDAIVTLEERTKH